MGVEIIKNAISPAIIRACEAAWPETNWNGWHRYKGVTADKYGSLHHSLIPRACMAALDALASVAADHIGDSFIDYDLHAAGLHMAENRGFLGRHIDAIRHPIRQWRRTHSIVMSVNSKWEPVWGGQLRLEGAGDNGADVIITPSPGTAIVFETDGQWHEVLPVTHSVQRKTIAMFAWTQCDDILGASSAVFSQE
jgi:hypothetical protein